MSGRNLVEAGTDNLARSLWLDLVAETEARNLGEATMRPYLHRVINNSQSIADAVVAVVSEKLQNSDLSSNEIRQLYASMMKEDAEFSEAVISDLNAVKLRDPACDSLLDIVLFMKGFHSLQAYRLSHWLYRCEMHTTAFFLQSRISEVFGVDIHPAAKLGSGIMFDHATGIVIGATSVIEDDVTLLQNVTLGGTGKEKGDRHPKIGRGVQVWAGAKILGNVVIGEYSQVGAQSVVLKNVPSWCTAVGIPARIFPRNVGDVSCKIGVSSKELIEQPMLATVTIS